LLLCLHTAEKRHSVIVAAIVGVQLCSVNCFWYSTVTRWTLVWGHLNKMSLHYKQQGVWMWS